MPDYFLAIFAIAMIVNIAVFALIAIDTIWNIVYKIKRALRIGRLHAERDEAKQRDETKQ